MGKGWIKLHRDILDWEWWGDKNTTILFLYILLATNHKDNKWRGITIQRGQLITSLNKLATNNGLSVQEVRTALEHLQSTSEVTSKTTNKYTLITVQNYEQWQAEQQATQQTSNKQSNKRATTNKNEEEGKNEKEEKKREREPHAHLSYLDNLSEELISEKAKKWGLSKEIVRLTAAELFNWCNAEGKRAKDYDAKLDNWLIREVKKQKKKGGGIRVIRP